MNIEEVKSGLNYSNEELEEARTDLEDVSKYLGSTVAKTTRMKELLHQLGGLFPGILNLLADAEKLAAEHNSLNTDAYQALEEELGIDAGEKKATRDILKPLMDAVLANRGAMSFMRIAHSTSKLAVHGLLNEVEPTLSTEEAKITLLLDDIPPCETSTADALHLGQEYRSRL